MARIASSARARTAGWIATPHLAFAVNLDATTSRSRFGLHPWACRRHFSGYVGHDRPTGFIRKAEDAMADVVSKPVERTVRGAVRGRPSLGHREQVTAALWPSLEALITDARGSIDRSPFLADLLAWHVGRPDVIRHTQLAIKFRTDDAVVDAPKPSGPRATRHVTVRVHPDVARELDRRARKSGLPRGVFVAEAIAESPAFAEPARLRRMRGCPWRCNRLRTGADSRRTCARTSTSS